MSLKATLELSLADGAQVELWVNYFDNIFIQLVFCAIRLRELTHMSPMALVQSRVRGLPLARVSRLCGLAASTPVVVKGALPDAPLLRSGVYLGGNLPLYHPMMGQLRTHQPALLSMAPLQVSFSCAGWPQFPFLFNFVVICVWGVVFLLGGRWCRVVV